MVYSNSATLHLYYDLEKSGYHGYDRRHYPGKHRLTLSESLYKPRGRAHIPSPPLEDEQWRPHGHHIEPIYSNIGPDWHSRIRPIPSPRNPNAKPTLPVSFIERNIHFMRPHPQNWQRSKNEWIYFSDESADSHSSKRNLFANIHFRSLEDLGDENVHMAQIGHKKKVLDVRNGLQKRSEGDKSYRMVELSPDFYKFGSTLPAINFGRIKKRYGHEKTFVPMKNETIPIIDEKDFEEKERQREHNQTVNEVIQLDNWIPADSMTRAFTVLDIESNDKDGIRYRPRFR
ncbi:unnamed protein product [Rotaria sp. Silwood1]|nr:unnamed protein product [Rotaria sp. Silwood1]CAF1228862.1 unnamed protein product [Rotaria sp. Silwood1]CAF3490645.1 unnamed protein product [Rotaria sp. Silwood1]CAF4882379.1 unnamed protein product [Rotaria sp. Silwood1]